MDTFYNLSITKLREIIDDNITYIEGLKKQVGDTQEFIKTIETRDKTTCPLCSAEMVYVKELIDLTIDTPTWWSSPFSPGEYFGRDDLIPSNWECQECGVFDYKLTGKILYHWTREDPPRSKTSLAALLFDTISLIDEVALTQFEYHKAFFISASGTWYSFGGDITKEDILARLNIDVRAGRVMPRNGFIYLIKLQTGHWKIGRTSDINNRMSYLGIKLPFEVEIVHTFSADDMYAAEGMLHKNFADKRINGEWFDLAIDEVDRIKHIAEYRNGVFV